MQSTNLLSCIGLHRIQLLVLLAAAMCKAADGAIIMMLTVLSSWIQCEFGVDPSSTALMNSLLFLGQLAGSVVQGVFVDWFGRQKTLLLFFCMASIVNVLFALSPTFAWIAFLRLALGFLLNPLAITYAIDFLPVKHRRLAGATFSFWSIGTLFGTALAIMASHGWSWRTVTILMSILPALTAIILSISPESPRYLYVSGQVEKARRLLRQMTAPGCDSRLHLETFPSSVNTQTKRTTIKDAIFHPRYRNVTLLQCILRFTVGLTYFGVASLSVTYFQQDEESSVTSLSTSCSGCTPLSRGYYIAQLYFAVGDLLGNVLMYMLVDRIGRRKTMITMSSLGTVLLLSLLAGKQGLLSQVIIFFLKAFVLAFRVTVTQFVSELYPTSIRGSLMAFGYVFLSVGAMLAPYVSEVLITFAFWLPIVLLSSVLGLCILVLMLIPVETSGQELKDF